MPTVSVVVTCIAGCLASGIGLAYFISVAKANQALAYTGDAKAARRIILPCYRPLFRGLVLFYVCFAVALGLSLFSDDNSFGLHGMVIYYCFNSLTVYSILPALLLQRSVSIAAFWNTFFLISPWWTICTIFWGLSFINAPSVVPFLVLFLIASALIPIGLSVGILLKRIQSRVQIGSRSNRNAVELLLIFSTVFGVAYTIDLSYHSETVSRNVEYLMVSLTFATNLIFPFALYRTLLADTKYWRGLGKHNKGITVNDDLRESGVDIVRPTMDMSIVSSSFQEMMSDVSNISIDFAFLYLERLIGQGATSKVFAGKFKQKLVAIKLSTPAEITEDVIDVFVSEAKIAAQLNHPNIVRFLGICVRPPQIAMVFEFCEGGNLKVNLQKHTDKWTTVMRLRACSDCSKAVECLHQMGYIHRDLKAENFFVGHKNIVKLGDFGESTLVRNRESTLNKRMTILGTVSFMAPEIIAASKYYTQSVDIYALAITFWEIWTGKDPYENVSQFDIYERVGKGFRPPLPDNAPTAFSDLMMRSWQQESSLRPDAKEVAQCMKEILASYTHQPKGMIVLEHPTESAVNVIMQPFKNEVGPEEEEEEDEAVEGSGKRTKSNSSSNRESGGDVGTGTTNTDTHNPMIGGGGGGGSAVADAVVSEVVAGATLSVKSTKVESNGSSSNNNSSSSSVRIRSRDDSRGDSEGGGGGSGRVHSVEMKEMGTSA